MRIVRGAVWWGVLVVCTTELLSASGFLGRPGVLIVWLLILSTWVALRVRQPATPRTAPTSTRRLNINARVYLVAILAILSVTCALALIAAPTSRDGLTYHMPRVAHWIQNQSVSFYPTNNHRQLWHNPWAEYVVLHLQLLSGSDRLANLVQWSALAGSTALVILIAGILGCERESQFFAGLFAATIPMAIAQSTGAKTDLVAGFWLLAFIAATLKENGSETGQRSANYALMLGASLGLAILTKGTNYVYALPFLVWWGLRQWHSLARRSMRQFGLVALVALALNATHYYRNFDLYRWPLGPREHDGLVNAAFGPRVVLSNLVRNAALHAGTPDDTRLPWSIRFNATANKLVEKTHNRLGIDVNDPRTTWRTYRFRVPFQSRNDTYAGNPVHFVLILISLGLVFFHPRARTRLATVYAICLAAQILLFCLAFRWQPFHSRLHLPVFLAAAPLVAWALSRTSRRWVMLLTAGVLVYGAIPAVLKNPARPLRGRGNVFGLTREQRYFIEHPQIQSSYTGAADFIARTGCRKIALHTGSGEWEYAFWAVARPRLGDFRLMHVGVTNASAALASKPPFSRERFCAVLTLHEDSPHAKSWTQPGFVTVWQQQNVTVQLPRQILPAPQQPR